MSTRNAGLIADPLFVGATRPPMRWGVTYSALLFNLVFTMEAFLLTKNLLTLLVCVPIHGTCMLLCARDARFFDLVLLWARTRLPAAFANLRHWKASSYSPLAVDMPDGRGRRREIEAAHVWPGMRGYRACDADPLRQAIAGGRFGLAVHVPESR
ncbi:MAG: type IV secretion system protein VirB3 [Proteobacteria bacterium]|nr:MAG: type IV secretion system protein VirB3 [Pseudomonadota bacterium]